jgi:hypothetical protein
LVGDEKSQNWGVMSEHFLRLSVIDEDLPNLIELSINVFHEDETGDRKV